MKVTIHNADIFLSGVALSNVYINKDHLMTIGKNVRDSKEIIKQQLNQYTYELLGITKELWSTEIKNSEIFNKFSKSHSAYVPISKREYVAICNLDDSVFDSSVISKDKLGILDKYTERINSFYSLKDFKIEDIEIKFYEYGNVTITGRLKIRDKSLNKEDYQLLSDFAHAYFGPALKEQVSKLIKVYIKTMRKIDQDDEVELHLLKIPMEVDNHDSDSEQFIQAHLLNFAIRYHFIYSTEIKNCDNFAIIFNSVLSGEWELNLQNTVNLTEASIYFGWTHSLVVLDDFDLLKSEGLYEKYKLPLEVVTANWGALDSLSKRLDNARANFLEDIERSEHSGMYKKRNFIKIADDIREFTLKVERIMESFDSYTVSNNPMHYRLIDLQQEVFLEQKSIERIRKKTDLVAKIVDELSVRQKNAQTSNLNKALVIITFLTVIDISKVIYEVFNSKPDVYLTIGGIILLLCTTIGLVNVFGVKRVKKGN